jgi:hypothetical protein
MPTTSAVNYDWPKISREYQLTPFQELLPRILPLSEIPTHVSKGAISKAQLHLHRTLKEVSSIVIRFDNISSYFPSTFANLILSTLIYFTKVLIMALKLIFLLLLLASLLSIKECFTLTQPHFMDPNIYSKSVTLKSDKY